MGRFFLTLGVVGLLAAAAGAAEIDWAVANEHDVIEVITVDADGDVRETKVWLCVLEGHGWLRTNDSRWYQNITRDSAITIRVDDTEHPVTASKVDDDALRVRVDDVCREKYGWQQKLLEFFGSGGGENLLRLVARERGEG